ncbi:MAG: hypothetical protein JXA92_05200, partial [candidate division Zixibacteria bacterium]|nr:hypothetical protein [candidate division Zixibacteria bacterium]
MNYKFAIEDFHTVNADTVVIFTAEFDKIGDKYLSRVDAITRGALSALFKTDEFSGKKFELTLVYQPVGFKARRIILAGLGEKKKIDSDTFRCVMGMISRMKTVKNSKKLALSFKGLENPAFCQAAVEGYFLGSYKMLDFKTGEARQDVTKVSEMSFLI